MQILIAHNESTATSLHRTRCPSYRPALATDPRHRTAFTAWPRPSRPSSPTPRHPQAALQASPLPAPPRQHTSHISSKTTAYGKVSTTRMLRIRHQIHGAFCPTPRRRKDLLREVRKARRLGDEWPLHRGPYDAAVWVDAARESVREPVQRHAGQDIVEGGVFVGPSARLCQLCRHT